MSTPNISTFVPGSEDWLALSQTLGVERLAGYIEFLLWSQEPLLALEVLDRVPASVADLPQVARFRADIERRIAHLRSFETYRAFYEREATERPPRIDQEFSTPRWREPLKWLASLPAEGPPIEILVIGTQHGSWEAKLLEAHPRVVATSCEIAREFHPDLWKLATRFPGRTRLHKVEQSVTDWPVGPFDVVFFYEVLEHVPSDDEALSALRKILKPGGDLWLSVPLQPVCPSMTLGNQPCDHVRAYTMQRLADKLKLHGFTGEVGAVGHIGILARVH